MGGAWVRRNLIALTPADEESDHEPIEDSDHADHPRHTAVMRPGPGLAVAGVRVRIDVASGGRYLGTCPLVVGVILLPVPGCEIEDGADLRQLRTEGPVGPLAK